LEYDYGDIINSINNKENFCIYGSTGVGKTTIIKLILKSLNVDYVYIETYTKNLDDILSSVSKKTVYSYFEDCHSIILFDNFDHALYKPTNQHCIFISNKPNKKMKNYFVNNPTVDFLKMLMSNIILLEDSKKIKIKNFTNYHLFFSELECSISSQQDTACEYIFKSDKNIYKQLFKPITLSERFKLANDIDDYSLFQSSYLSGITSLESAVKATESISFSLQVEKTEFYPVLGLVIPSHYIDKTVTEVYIKQNYTMKRACLKKYSSDEILWNPMKKLK